MYVTFHVRIVEAVEDISEDLVSQENFSQPLVIKTGEIQLEARRVSI